MDNKRSIFLSLVAVVATMAALWFTNRAVTPRTATWDDVVAEAKNGGYRLISTEELAGRYSKDPGNLLMVDTRQDWEFRTGHIKGAVNFPMEPTWWSRWRKADALAALLGADKTRPVVFY